MGSTNYHRRTTIVWPLILPLLWLASASNGEPMQNNVAEDQATDSLVVVERLEDDISGPLASTDMTNNVTDLGDVMAQIEANHTNAILTVTKRGTITKQPLTNGKIGDSEQQNSEIQQQKVLVTTTSTNLTSEQLSTGDSNEELIQLPLYMRIVATIACVIIMAIGVTGNLLVPLVVIKTKDLRNSTNLFLINLSVADVVVLIVCMPLVLNELHSKPETWPLGEQMCKVTNFVEMLAANGSILTILAISFERYYAICKPLLAGYKCTKLRAAIIICIVWFLAILLTSPIIAMAKLQSTIHNDGSPVEKCILEGTDFWHKTYVVVLMIAFFCSPLVVLILVYWLIAKRLVMETTGAKFMPTTLYHNSNHQHFQQHNNRANNSTNNQEAGVQNHIVSSFLQRGSLRSHHLFKRPSSPTTIVSATTGTTNTETTSTINNHEDLTTEERTNDHRHSIIPSTQCNRSNYCGQHSNYHRKPSSSNFKFYSTNNQTKQNTTTNQDSKQILIENSAIHPHSRVVMNANNHDRRLSNQNNSKKPTLIMLAKYRSCASFHQTPAMPTNRRTSLEVSEPTSLIYTSPLIQEEYSSEPVINSLRKHHLLMDKRFEKIDSNQKCVEGIVKTNSVKEANDGEEVCQNSADENHPLLSYNTDIDNKSSECEVLTTSTRMIGSPSSDQGSANHNGIPRGVEIIDNDKMVTPSGNIDSNQSNDNNGLEQTEAQDATGALPYIDNPHRAKDSTESTTIDESSLDEDYRIKNDKLLQSKNNKSLLLHHRFEFIGKQITFEDEDDENSTSERDQSDSKSHKYSATLYLTKIVDQSIKQKNVTNKNHIAAGNAQQLQASQLGSATKTHFILRNNHAMLYNNSQQMKSRRQVVVMLGFVVACFFLLHFPYRILTIWITFSTLEQIKSLGMETYYSLVYFSRILIYLHSAINPIAYNLISTKFRRAFIAILCCRDSNTRHKFTTEYRASNNSTNKSSSANYSRHCLNGSQRNNSIATTSTTANIDG